MMAKHIISDGVVSVMAPTQMQGKLYKPHLKEGP